MAVKYKCMAFLHVICSPYPRKLSQPQYFVLTIQLLVCIIRRYISNFLNVKAFISTNENAVFTIKQN